MSHIFSSESVGEGHPDKICDQISDAVLDAAISKDPNSRVACEVAVKTGLVLVFGEISTKADLNIESIVRNTLKEIGYGDPKFGFPADDVQVMVKLDKQSPDIAQGVDSRDGDHGAGDQGMMFGAAVKETETLMPLPITMAHNITRKLAQLRKQGTLDYLGPDNKSQLSFIYDENKNELPIGISTVVVSTQHSEEVSLSKITTDLLNLAIKPVLGKWWKDDINVLVNPTGKFVIGGPVGDAGLTGRKIIVDTYGGWARHGGGAFSGKDPTKVDRSAAYMMRYIAKNIIASGLAYNVEVQIAYAIGQAEPVSLFVNTFGTGVVSDTEIADLIKSKVSFKPKAIIERLDLKRPIYKQTASYGHFGREDLDLPWEKLDLVSDFKN